MQLASFDLEIAKELPDEMENWVHHAPLGITCAAVALSDSDEIKLWKGVPQLSQSESIALVRDLQDLVHQGYQLLTWNGTSFDFQVLAQKSGLVKECGELALTQIDMMLFVTFQKGWYLSLEKALIGAGISGKLKHVFLSDGTEIDDMGGARTPRLWAEGEYQAVLAYLKEDVVQSLQLAFDIQRRRKLTWTSNRGSPMSVAVGKLFTVRECFQFPEPDTSWMTDPPTREQFVSWIPS